MSTKPFNATIEKAELWLNEIMCEEIMCEIGYDGRQRAYHALRATLHALRDRLPPEEAVHLGAQLPTLIRGMYYDGWTLSGKPIKWNRNEFLDAVRSSFRAGRQPEPEPLIRAVLKVVAHHVTAGEIKDVKGLLPEEIRELWPEAA